MIRTRDPEEWARAWTTMADRYLARAKTTPTLPQADADYPRAWRLHSFGGWPAPTSADRQVAYQNAVITYLLHAATFDPPLEVVRTPFKGPEIVGYLRRRHNANRPVPVVIGISGLDSRKKNLLYQLIDQSGRGMSLAGPLRQSPEIRNRGAAVLAGQGG
jgi:esterase FrsA